MTEKPFIHRKAYSNLRSNFMFHEELVKILPKIINQKGILNVGGPKRSVYDFARLHNKKILKKKISKNDKIPLNQTMNLIKLNKILKKN